jgi:hypothetical protein
MRMFHAVAFLLFAFGAVHAIDIGGCSASAVDTLVRSSVGGLIGVVSALVIFTMGVVYIVGTAAERPELVVLAKDEIYNLLISLMVLLMFGTVMAAGCTVLGGAFDTAYRSIHDASSTVVDACYDPSGTPQEISVCYLKQMQSDSSNIIERYTRENINFLIDGSAYSNYYGLLGGTTFAPKAYKRTQAAFIDTVKNMFVLPAYMSISAQLILMRFFIGTGANTSSAVLSLILPAAFILRLLPPTRMVGNMMVGFSVGIYLIIPLLLALNGIVYAYGFSAADCATFQQAIRDDQILPMGACDSPYNLFNVARLYPQAFLLPNIAIVLFVVFANSISKALRMM